MDPHEDVIGSGVLGVATFIRIAADTSASTLVGADEAYPAFGLILDAYGVVGDYIEGDGFLFVDSGVSTVGAATFLSARMYPMLVAPTMVVRDGLYPRLLLDTVDGGVLSETLFADEYTLATSTGTVGASFSSFTVSRPVLYVSGTVGDVVFAYKVEDLQVTGVLSETLALYAVVRALLADSGVVGSEAVLQGGVYDIAISQGALSDALFADATLYALLTSAGFGWGTVLALGSAAWSANSDNWAGSRYEPFDFASVTSFRGELYATGPTGLVKVGAERDEAADIAARVTSNLTDFGEKRLKLPRAVYLGYTSNQALTVTMSATDDGVETEYEYTAPPRVADTYVPDRIGLGRGLRSRYLRFTLANESGGDFSIDSAFLDADVSERRV